MLVNFKISNKFKERINKIESPITKAFLNLKKIDNTKENYRNYISVAFDNKSLVSFLDKRKEEQLGENILKLTPRYDLAIGDDVLISEQAYKGYYDKRFKCVARGSGSIPYYYLGMPLKTKITDMSWRGCLVDIKLQHTYINGDYLIPLNPKYNIHSIVSEVWNHQKRLKAKISKLINTLFPNIFSEKDIEYFTLEYQKQGLMESGLENASYKIYSGEEIKYAYLNKNYYNNKGDQLHQSCMRYESCQEFFNIYSQNTNQVELLALVTLDGNEKIRARCILWYPEGKNNKDALKYYDRIYYDSTEDKTQMEIYLESNGYINVYNDKKFQEVEFKLESGFRSDWKYPYMDSFKYLNTDGMLSTYSKNFNFTLESTSGEYTEETNCSCCGDTYDSDSMYYIQRGRYGDEYLCEDCSTYCEDIEERVLNDDSVYSSYDSADYYKENCVHSTILDSYILRNDAILLYNNDYTHTSEYYETCVDNEHFLKDDSNFIKIEDEWYNISNYNIIIDFEGNNQLEENCVYIKDIWYSKNSDCLEYIDNEYKLKENVEI